MVDEDWWMGENAKGQAGLFPSNYVELVEDGDAPAATSTTVDPSSSASAAGHLGGTQAKPTATALYDYEAAGRQHRPPHHTSYADRLAEDNEISFPDGATITNLVRLLRFASLCFSARPLPTLTPWNQEFPDEDWWMGEYKGKAGLFPANYVEVDK